MASLTVCLMVWLEYAFDGSVIVMVYPKGVCSVITWLLIVMRIPIAFAARRSPDMGPWSLSTPALACDSIS